MAMFHWKCWAYRKWLVANFWFLDRTWWQKQRIYCHWFFSCLIDVSTEVTPSWCTSHIDKQPIEQAGVWGNNRRRVVKIVWHIILTTNFEFNSRIFLLWQMTGAPRFGLTGKSKHSLEGCGFIPYSGDTSLDASDTELPSENYWWKLVDGFAKNFNYSLCANHFNQSNQNLYWHSHELLDWPWRARLDQPQPLSECCNYLQPWGCLSNTVRSTCLAWNLWRVLTTLAWKRKHLLDNKDTNNTTWINFTTACHSSTSPPLYHACSRGGRKSTAGLGDRQERLALKPILE